MPDLACEDLATKAELQQLRNQLNILLGTSSAGSAIDVLNQGNFNNTHLGNLLNNAITDISIEQATAGIAIPITIGGIAAWNWLADTATGTAKSLPSMGRLSTAVSGTLAKAQLALEGLKSTAALLPILSFLASAGVTLVLTNASVTVLGERIDQNEQAIRAFDKDYINVLTLYNKANKDISALNATLAQNEITFNAQIAINSQQQQDIIRLRSNIQTLEQGFRTQQSALDEANQQITNANIAITELETALEAANLQHTEDINYLTLEIESLNAQLTNANEVFDEMFLALQNAQQVIAAQEEKITKNSADIVNLQLLTSYYRSEFIALKLDIEEQRDLINNRLNTIEAKIILDQERRAATGGGGIPLSVQSAITTIQNSTLRVLEHLGAPEGVIVPNISWDDVLNDYGNAYDNAVNELLSWTVTREDSEQQSAAIGAIGAELGVYTGSETPTVRDRLTALENGGAGGVTIEAIKQEVDKGVEPFYRRVGDVEATANSFYRRTEEYQARIETETAQREARYAAIQQGNDTKIQQLEEGQQLNEQQYTALLNNLATVGTKVDALPESVATEVERKVAPAIGSVSTKVDSVQAKTNDTFDELGALKVASIAGFTTVAAQTTRDAIAIGAEQGMCQATTPDGCLSPTGNWANQLGDTVKNNLNNVLGGINAFLNTVILPIVTSTNQVVKSTEGKLDVFQSAFDEFKKFSERAWTATGADKILSIFTFVASTHNAMMLSRNLGETMGDATSSVLRFLNIKGIDNAPIDVNEIIGKTVTGALNDIFGAANVAAAKKTFAAANRIITAGAGAINAIRQTKDAAIEAHEIVGGWVAMIGNSMKREGILEEDAFPWFNEKPGFRDHYQGFRNKIENLEEAGEQITALASAGIEIQEGFNESAKAFTELTKALDDFDKKEDTQEAARQAGSSPPSTLQLTDLVEFKSNDTNASS
jgi:hypothetical protein